MGTDTEIIEAMAEGMWRAYSGTDNDARWVAWGDNPESVKQLWRRVVTAAYDVGAPLITRQVLREMMEQFVLEDCQPAIRAFAKSKGIKLGDEG